MGTTTTWGLPYPDGVVGVPPDIAGDIEALAAAVDALLASGNWAPSLGGTNASAGANAGFDGGYFRIGRFAVISGRIVFGSSASFGTGAAVVGNLPVTLDPAHSTGYGTFQQADSNGNPTGHPVPLAFTPSGTNAMFIRPIYSNGSGVSIAPPAYQIGTPAQSSVLTFTLNTVSP